MREALLMIAVPLGAALITYLVHRWKLAFWVAGAASGFLAWALLKMPPIPRADLSAPLGALCALAAFYFVIGALSPASPYIPFWGLISLGCLIASLQMGPGAMGMLLLALAFIIFLPALFDGKSLNPSGAIGLMLASLLPLLSVTILKPGLLLPDYLNLLPLSLLLLLGFVPLHIWTVALFRGSSPYGAGFILAILRTGVVLWLGRVWSATAFGSELVRLLQGLALASLAWAGLRGFASRDFQELAGYASAADGGILLALILSPRHTDPAFHYMLAAMPGFVVLLSGVGFLAEARLKERGYPMAALLLLAGTFSIAGLPVTPGFTARALALKALSRDAFHMAILLAGLGLLLGGMRLLRPYSRAIRLDEEMQRLPRAALLLTVAVAFGWMGMQGV